MIGQDTHLECVQHRLAGREVIDPSTGRRGILGSVLVERSRATDRVVKRTAHLRPVDGSGWEWTADPRTLKPAVPVNPDTHPKVMS